MERIFGATVGGSNLTRYDDDDDYTRRVKELIDDSVSFEMDTLGDQRDENQKYYNGIYPNLVGTDARRPYDSTDERPEDEIPNKSAIVSSDVRDTVMSILPSLVRIFMGPEKVVTFQPKYSGQEDIAKQQTEYVDHVIMEDNEGFLMLHTVFKDTMITKYSAVQVWTDTDHEMTEQTYQNVTVEQVQQVIFEAGEDLEIIEQISDPDDPAIIESVTFRFQVSKPVIRVDPVPPEEFRISRYAKTAQTSRLLGRERVVTRSYLLARGYDEAILEEFEGDAAQIAQYTDERFMRNEGLDTDIRGEGGIIFGEWYIRVDGDGDGIDELRYITTLGGDHEVFEDYIVPYPKFALFNCDPTPHTAIGMSITDLIKDIQKIKTNMIRGVLDNLAEANNPRTVVNELLTNIEDALNDEVGAVIRTRGNVNEAVGFSKVPFIGKDSMDVINYLDQLRASRTGITEASKGLDPDAMQSTALAGINAVIEGAQERIELIARILAETGFKDLYKIVLREVTANPNQQRTIQVRGRWVDMPINLFDPTLRVKVNPTMGKGSDTVRMQALQTIGAAQKEVLAQFGPKNSVVTPDNYLNTMEDMMELVNIRDLSRYFNRMTPDQVQQMMEAPDEPSPETLLAQAEMEKVKKDLVVADSKMNQEDKKLLIDQEKIKIDDDFRRDELEVKSMWEFAKLQTEAVVDQQVEAANRADSSHE